MADLNTLLYWGSLSVAFCQRVGGHSPLEVVFVTVELAWNAERQHLLDSARNCRTFYQVILIGMFEPRQPFL